jgi:hypothetical protein
VGGMEPGVEIMPGWAFDYWDECSTFHPNLLVAIGVGLLAAIPVVVGGAVHGSYIAEVRNREIAERTNGSTCPACQGTGTAWQGGKEVDCWKCEGFGRQKASCRERQS